MTQEAFAPHEVLRVLNVHGVRYVVIGGFAAILHGSPTVTQDVDVTPQSSTENLQRLADALRELRARIRTDAEPEGLPFDASGESLRGLRMLSLVTANGAFDISVEPSGTQGYPDLRQDAVLMRIDDVEFFVASLADVIRSKEAAGRAKDRLVLPLLRELLDRQQRESR